MSNPLLRISSARAHILVFAMVLLFVNASALMAQNANTPAGNTNANTGANSNANVNANTNTQNTNTNTNANANTNQSDTAAAVAQEDRRTRIAATYWFPVVVAAMFGLVLIPFAFTIIRAIRYSKSTFNNPLGLPEGSLRAMLAFMLVSFLGFYVLASILSISEIKPPEFLIGIVATVIGFYFGSRTTEDKGTSTPPRTGSVAGTVTDPSGSPAVGATVELLQSGVKKFTQATDLNGKYKIENVPIGDYDIQASLGSHSNSAKVKVAAAATQTVDLKLK
jgi:hypothetical protein